MIAKSSLHDFERTLCVVCLSHALLGCSILLSSKRLLKVAHKVEYLEVSLRDSC